MFHDIIDLDRTVHLRRHGDGYRVTVEPHPYLPDGSGGLDRRFAGYDRARGEMLRMSAGKGWAYRDHVEQAAPAPADPVRRVGRSRVFLSDTQDGLYAVTVEPRPWGWPRGEWLFRDLAKAQRKLAAVRAQLAADEAKRKRLYGRR